jgi:hypothetical protein
MALKEGDCSKGVFPKILLHCFLDPFAITPPPCTLPSIQNTPEPGRSVDINGMDLDESRPSSIDKDNRIAIENTFNRGWLGFTRLRE